MLRNGLLVRCACTKLAGLVALTRGNGLERTNRVWFIHGKAGLKQAMAQFPGGNAGHGRVIIARFVVVRPGVKGGATKTRSQVDPDDHGHLRSFVSCR